jgi:sugar lactone lactonase YvrE
MLARAIRRSRARIPFAVAVALALLGCVDDPPCGAARGDLCLVAGTSEFGFNGDGLAPEHSDLYLVSAARRGPDGRLYLMDFNNQRLRRIGDEGLLETFVGNGYHALADTDAPRLETPLENPIDFGFFADGRLVFVSYHDPRILTLAGDGTLETIAGAADGVTGIVGDEGDGGPARDALFIQLDGIAVGPGDVLYVSDSLANRVRKIEDGIIETVVGTGEGDYRGDGGPGTAAALHWPTALELDDAGNLYIADTFNHVIRRLDPDGTLTTVVGTGVRGFSGDGGDALVAELSQPFGLALDRAGDALYISDRGNHRIRRVSADNTIETVAGIGVEGIGRPGPALDSPLGYTARIAVDGDALLIADQSNAMVWNLRIR